MPRILRDGSRQLELLLPTEHLEHDPDTCRLFADDRQARYFIDRLGRDPRNQSVLVSVLRRVDPGSSGRL
ncbi:MAG: hypothetical protein ACYS22_12495, partial [Planctomycetota bacterium]